MPRAMRPLIISRSHGLVAAWSAGAWPIGMGTANGLMGAPPMRPRAMRRAPDSILLVPRAMRPVMRLRPQRSRRRTPRIAGSQDRRARRRTGGAAAAATAATAATARHNPLPPRPAQLPVFSSWFPPAPPSADSPHPQPQAALATPPHQAKPRQARAGPHAPSLALRKAGAQATLPPQTTASPPLPVPLHLPR